MNLMLETLTLLINPFIDFFSASHAMRWYSLLVLSVIWDWSARSRAGGMYVPPDRIVNSFSYSAFAAACLSPSDLVATSMVEDVASGRAVPVVAWSRSREVCDRAMKL